MFVGLKVLPYWAGSFFLNASLAGQFNSLGPFFSPVFFASSLADSAQNPRVQWAFAPPPPAGSSTTAQAAGAGAPASRFFLFYI